MKYNCAEKGMFDGLTKSRYDESIPSNATKFTLFKWYIPILHIISIYS